MEIDTNSPDLPSDAINIIVEFTDPVSSEEVIENGETVRDSSDKTVHVVHISPMLLNPAVSSQTLSKNGVNSTENTAVEVQETSNSDVVEKLKKCLTGKKTSKPANSNLLPTLLPKTTISYPLKPLVNLQQPSISLCIKRGKVTCTQTPQSAQYDAGLEKDSNAPITRQAETTANPARGTQITNATKLALKNFLKKKSARNVNSRSDETGKSAADSGMQIISPAEEAGNLSKKVGMCSGQGSDTDKERNLSDVPAATEREKSCTTVPISESSSLNPMLSSQDPNVLPNEVTSAVVQDVESNSPLPKQSDVIQHEGEHNQQNLMEQGCKDGSASTKELCTDLVKTSTTDVSKEASSPLVQEVDVVVLPCLLEPDNSEHKKERSQGTPCKGKSGAKKNKAKKSLECVECGRVLTSKRAYKAHMNIHYDIRPYKCTECGKSFRQRGHLEKHKLLHTGKKPYVCQYCGRGFRCRYQHRDHERIHTGEKPCKCNLCGKMFRCLNTVSVHQWSVHKVGRPRSRVGIRNGEKKAVHTCEVCGKTFTWSSALSAHKKTHTNLWPYKCNKCPKVFKHSSNLWNHKRTHNTEKPFECDLCGQHLKRRGNLKRHILTQHDAEEAEECLRTSKQFEASRAKKAKQSY